MLTPTETTGTATRAAASIVMSPGAARSMAGSVRSPSRDARNLDSRPPRARHRPPRRCCALTNVEHRYGAAPTFADLDLSLASGEICCLLGPSGCGKTTALRCIGGFERIAAGRIAIDGAVVSDAGGTHLPPERRRIGMVFQDFALFPHLDVARNVAFGIADRGRRPRRAPPSCSPRSASSGPASAGRTSSPAGSSSASRSPARSPRRRACSCSTSRSPTSTPACARRSPPTCARSSRPPAPPPSSSPTTSTRRSRWPTGSPS